MNPHSPLEISPSNELKTATGDVNDRGFSTL